MLVGICPQYKNPVDGLGGVPIFPEDAILLSLFGMSRRRGHGYIQAIPKTREGR